MQKDIFKTTDSFNSISLAEMEGVSLLKRTDTKYILSQSVLGEVLEEVESQYRILEVNNIRLMNYRSLYFDTSNRDFYHQHHNGKIKRTKIRMRQYVDSDLHFLEVKMKDGRSNTIKTRMPLSGFENIDSPILQNFIQDTTKVPYDLEAVLWNQFKRITLVNTELKERVTVDIDLSFDFKEKDHLVSNLAIIELKQERFNANSPIVKTLRKHGVKAFGFSKYCIGMIKLWGNLKYNAFKPKLLKVQKISA